MAMFCSVLLLTILLVIVYSAPQDIKNEIVFLEETQGNIKQNGRLIEAPAKCDYNELFYPGDQKDDWICDCRPGHLYDPISGHCWHAFRKGPCLEGQYLILRGSSAVPVCVTNPCILDNFVAWNNQCEKLGSFQPCSSQAFPSAVHFLGINSTTFTVECISVPV